MTDKQKQILELKKLEAKLKHDVDADFFLDPSQFRTLPRVIDILGAQLLKSEDTSGLGGFNHGLNQHQASAPNLPSITDHKSHFDQLHNNNPAYSSLRNQQNAVEESIEHLSLVHYKHLNSSVVAVGQVSKRFGEAVGQVKGLRTQVQEIREHLANASVGTGTTEHHDRGRSRGRGLSDLEDGDDEEKKVGSGSVVGKNGGGGNSMNGAAEASLMASHQIGGKSLRELWLKKLECEAVLSLLQKLQVIRETPGAFDALVHSQPCRIGAAVVLLTDAIDTMFKDDVAQIQALNNIAEHLITRKQKAEEIVWETLQDVLYLRTGNYTAGAGHGQLTALENGGGFSPTNIHVDLDKGMSVGSSKQTYSADGGAAAKRRAARNSLQIQQRKHLYISTFNQRNNDGDSDDSDDSMSMYSEEYSSKSGQNSADKRSSQRIAKPNLRKSTSSGAYFASGAEDASANLFANFDGHEGLLLPKVMVESELDLEADELRCLETFGNTAYSTFSNDGTLILPRYNDPILGLRILIEALAKLGRLDDMERCISENIDRELRRITETEQAKTLAKLEKRRNKAGGTGKRRNAAMGLDAADEKLKDFKMHMKSLLTSFGSVILRLTHLAQIFRHRIALIPEQHRPSFPDTNSALNSVLVAANVTIQREIKSFLHGCLNEDEKLKSAFQTMRMVTPSMMGNFSNRSSRSIASTQSVRSNEPGIFSLGVINDASLASSIRDNYSHNLSSATRSSVMRMSAKEYVTQVLCPRTGVVPQISHALVFRKAIAAWTKECESLKSDLAIATRVDTSSPAYNATTDENAISYLDKIIKKTLLPMMQDAAVNGTVSALERPDAFEPITGVGIYNSSVKGKKLKVEMCAACQGLYTSTGPLFSALPKLPRGGDMYSPLVAVLEHAILTFLSRVKQRVLELCDGKKAFQLLEDKHSRRPTQLSNDMESRKPFTLLWNSYFDDDSLRLETTVDAPSGRSSINPIAPSSTDTKSKNANDDERSGRIPLNANFEGVDQLQREQESFEQEVSHLLELLNFTDPRYGGIFKLSTEEEFLKAVSLSHSLLKLSSQLERRLRPKKNSWDKVATAPRTLRDSIKNIRMHGLRLAKFCRVEVLLQTVQRMSTIYQSSTLSAKDAVRLPTSVNSLGEYLSSISDQMREFGGNKLAAYALSSLEQYVPLFIMETVRIIAVGDGLPHNFKISLHGVESLDKCCSVLYRDLKSATGFENSFWDEDVAADAFDRAVSYVALMECDMDELMSRWRNNRSEFTDDDYRIMFAMSGPNRKGDIQKYASLKERMR